VLAAHSDPETKHRLIEQLADEARKRMEQGERHIREQRDRIARLKRDRHDTRAAERLLRNFGETQVLQKQHARLRREAAALAGRKPRAIEPR
jgi:hypothetical protein